MIFIRFFFTTVRYSLSTVPIWYTSVLPIYLFAQSLFTIIITYVYLFLLQTCKMFAIIILMYIEIYIFFYFNSFIFTLFNFHSYFLYSGQCLLFFNKTEFTFIATILHLMFNVIDLMIYMFCGDHGGGGEHSINFN